MPADVKSLLETVKKYMTEIRKNAKTEGIVQPLTDSIVSFLSSSLLAQNASPWARLSAGVAAFMGCSLDQQRA